MRKVKLILIMLIFTTGFVHSQNTPLEEEANTPVEYGGWEDKASKGAHIPKDAILESNTYTFYKDVHYLIFVFTIPNNIGSLNAKLIDVSDGSIVFDENSTESGMTYIEFTSEETREMKLNIKNTNHPSNMSEIKTVFRILWI